ncbi:MAG: hypothetical protein JNK05_26690 [Myxococcales bacterium]|nr:hypothetical protein [Myxococcales bacterium]
MTINVSLRRGAQGAQTTEQPTAAEGATATTQPSGAGNTRNERASGREADVVPGQGPSRQAQRLDRLEQGARQETTCRAAPSEAQLVAQYRATIAAGGQINIPPAPPLPTRDGATLMRELNVPEPRMPRGHQQLIDNGSAPITGCAMPYVMHAIERAIGTHASSTTHLGVELGVHAVQLTAELGHMLHLEHLANAAAAHASAGSGQLMMGVGGPIALSAAGTLLMLDATVGTVFETYQRMNNGTLPTPQGIIELLRERAPELIAQARTRVQRQLEQQFNAGALAAARGEAPPANADRAFSRGYAAGVEYRRQHGCAFDEHARALRAVNIATRGTSRDASQGVRPLTAERERPAGVVTPEQLRALIE